MHGSLTKRFNKLGQLKGSRLALYVGMPVFAVVAFLIFAFLPIFSGTIVKSVPVAYSTQNVNDATMELGDTKTKQAGADGIKKIAYSEPRSLFNLIFGGREQSKLTEKSSTLTKQPEPEIVSSGTLRYQYMYCSSGSYRYYTDEQMKNPTTGFTHKSPDYCAKNNQGTETGLGNTPSATSTAKSENGCTNLTFPYATLSQDVTWLPVGQTQTVPGMNGTDTVCNGKVTVISRPVNAIVYTGISSGSSTTEAPQSTTVQPSQPVTNSAGMTESQVFSYCTEQMAEGNLGSGQSELDTCMHQHGF